jgi:hypothetical protein
MLPGQDLTPNPCALPEIEYSPDDLVRRVQALGIVKFKGRRLRTSTALHGEPVALRADRVVDGAYDVFYRDSGSSLAPATLQTHPHSRKPSKRSRGRRSQSAIDLPGQELTSSMLPGQDLTPNPVALRADRVVDGAYDVFTAIKRSTDSTSTKPNPILFEVSPMSSHGCYLCLRSAHGADLTPNPALSPRSRYSAPVSPRNPAPWPPLHLTRSA